MRWPKISANDPLVLREFADFLQGCAEVIPHIKGLAILNDCEENHKLLKKLPEWIVQKWSHILNKLDMFESYPSLACFTSFLNKEAWIACNPIASPLLMNLKTTEVTQESQTLQHKGSNEGFHLKDTRVILL